MIYRSHGVKVETRINCWIISISNEIKQNTWNRDWVSLFIWTQKLAIFKSYLIFSIFEDPQSFSAETLIRGFPYMWKSINWHKLKAIYKKLTSFETTYSRMAQVKFVEDSLLKNLPKQTISRLFSINFTWSILEYTDRFVKLFTLSILCMSPCLKSTSN